MSQIEPLPSGLRSNSYNHRFPTPQLASFDYSKGKGGMALPGRTSEVTLAPSKLKVPMTPLQQCLSGKLCTGASNESMLTAVRTAAVLSPACCSGPSFFPAVSQDKPFANLYYTVELPGVMTYISLTSYAPGQTFDHTEAQYVWLSELLEKVRAY